MGDWQPESYLKFADERSLPVQDLLSRIAAHKPKKVADLGCGPGNSTAVLRSVFPDAHIAGIDSSPAMIQQARKRVPDATFTVADVAEWSPGDEDLVFSNALFQWLPDRDAHILRIFEAMKPGAVFAVQMPDNLDEPSHRMMLQTALTGPWKKKLTTAGEARRPLKSALGYIELLEGISVVLHIWRTTYHHALDGHQGIVDMLSSTGLRPYLEPLSTEEREAFTAAYHANLVACYPPMVDGRVLLAFPRLFLMAIRGDS